MSTSSTEQGRGSHLVDNNEQVTAAIAKADQMAWEAPDLRPVKIKYDGKPMRLFSPCPEWCVQSEQGHDPETATGGNREHEGAPLKIRMERLFPYETRKGAVWPHLAVSLILPSRNVAPQVRLVQHYGGAGGEKTWGIGTLYFDEVRELIVVLQHLMKLGQDS